MNDIATLFQVIATFGLVVAPVVLAVRFLAGSEGVRLEDLFAIPVDLPWPRGVQEEEPVRWHVERLALAAYLVGKSDFIDSID